MNQIILSAAQAAFKEGVSAGNQSQLEAWIETNCNYDPDNLFFLVLLIGSALADIEAQEQGYKSEVHRAFCEARKTFVQKHGREPDFRGENWPY